VADDRDLALPGLVVEVADRVDVVLAGELGVPELVVGRVTPHHRIPRFDSS
jgi:hypothetical protein